jgi:hypothetical protein
MRIDQYHGAVLAHIRTRRKHPNAPVWWRELGQILDAWGKESAEIAAHRGCLPWQLRLFRAFWFAWLGIMIVLIMSGGW